MLSTAEKIDQAVAHLRSRWETVPRAGIILGSGLGGFADQMQVEAGLPYDEIPHFPQATVIGHQGRWLMGTVDGVPVVTMAGRFHFYEGYSIKDVVLPVRVMRALGAELLIVSNASGGLNPQYGCGDIMVIDDHINWMFANPLMGANDDSLGPRFPDMSSPYDPDLIAMAISIARENGFTAHRGVYMAMSGPTYETRAEYRMQRTLGADVAGMSTVPEVLAATHAGMKVLALSAVTNLCRPDTLEPADGAEVVEAAGMAEPRMTQIVLGILKRMGAANGASQPCEGN